MTTYHVISWNDNKIIETVNNLPEAKRKCKALGHTGLDVSILTGYPPVAYVANENMEVVYNPRFKKSTCKHPPERLYSWYANNENLETVLCVCCCDCGAVLKN